MPRLSQWFIRRESKGATNMTNMQIAGLLGPVLPTASPLPRLLLQSPAISWKLQRSFLCLWLSAHQQGDLIWTACKSSFWGFAPRFNREIITASGLSGTVFLFHLTFWQHSTWCRQWHQKVLTLKDWETKQKCLISGTTTAAALTARLSVKVSTTAPQNYTKYYIYRNGFVSIQR